MAKKFLTDIDLSQNELLNAVMQNLTTAPQNPKVGQLYYNTTDKIMYQWDGTAWKPVGNVYIQGNGIVISASNVVSADFATNAEATAGSSTTKVMSPVLVKAVIQTLDVNGFAQGVVAANGSTITIKGLKEEDGKVVADSNNNLVIKIDASHGYDATDNPLATVGTVNAAKTASAVTVETGSESETNFVSYTLKQGGATVGTINIPKFLVVKDGSVVTGTWSGTTFTEDATQPGSGKGKAIKLVLNDSEDAGTADDVLYINVADLVDIYTGGAGITITANNVVKAKMVTESNGSQTSETPSNNAGRQYPVVPDANGNLSVNVPWANSTYTQEKLGQGYATCSTAAATAAKAATLSNYNLVKGGVVAVKFDNAVPASATLNVNSKGAKDIYFKGAAITANVIQAGDTATFMYDGSKYHLLAVDRLCKTAVTGVSWPSTSSHYVTVTYAEGSTENITIHPTNTAYPASGSGAAVPTKNQTPAFGQTFNVPQVVTDDFGHVTAQNTRTVTIPDTTATQLAPGLMSTADKAKLDSMTHIMRRYEVTNPSLTYNSSTGTCVWQIAASSMGGGDPRHAICSLRDSSGNEVIADMTFSQQYITVTFNASATIAAGAYTANIIIPIAA